MDRCNRNQLVLIVDEDPTSARAIARLGRQDGYACLAFTGEPSYSQWLRESGNDIAASHDAGCIVFDSKASDIFTRESEVPHFHDYPRICIARPEDFSTVLKSIRFGLFDLLEKPFGIAAIRETICLALQNYDELVARQALMEISHKRLDGLTKREVEVCELLSNGRSAKWIADRLGISTKTFYVHQANLMRKLGVSSMIEFTKLYQLVVGQNKPYRWPGLFRSQEAEES